MKNWTLFDIATLIAFAAWVFGVRPLTFVLEILVLNFVTFVFISVMRTRGERAKQRAAFWVSEPRS
jgi:hypothetical protein